jgi:imidazolonepropionase-like amidohydrolase
MRKISTFFSLFLIFIVNIFAQNNTTFPINGVDDYKDKLYAFTNATIYSDYKTKYTNATLLIKNGEVVQVGASINIPKDAIIIDLQGKYIYPSFIDLYSNYGMPSSSKKQNSDDPQFISNKKGAYGWNEAIKPEILSNEEFSYESGKADEYKKIGFGSVVSHINDGIARGSGVLVSLNNSRENLSILRPQVSNHLSFSKGTSTQDYPSSQMGCIALLRQTYLDALWYKNSKEQKEYNISLDYWNKNTNLPQIFDANGKLNILRADRIADEFATQYIIKSTTGDEYQRAKEIKATNSNLIISLNFPKVFDVEDPYDAMNVSLDDMLHWETAPANPYLLNKEGILFSFTLDGLEKKEDFLGNLRKAVQYGLSEEEALKALTFNPALFIKAQDILGSLDRGKIANFIITSSSLFEKDCIIYQNWIQGKKNTINKFDFKDIRATYDLNINGKINSLVISGTPEKPEAIILKSDTSKIKVELTRNGNLISINFNLPNDKDTTSNFYGLSGSISNDMNTWSGNFQNKDGAWYKWNATRVKDFQEKVKPKVDEKNPTYSPVLYPYVSYGNIEIPKQENVLFKNTTVWTNEKDGILKNTDVLVLNGKIVGIGKNINNMGAKVIDASGKHITCGIIDEHSHIAINNGVNEGTQSSSAEVRIGDVLNSDDINMYRQLSGGVVAAQLLHGSANPIGGQSALIKFRWGVAPEQLKIEGADGFIKFALGENVKQSNWGDRNTIRFPQTRMGVEQTYYNYFTKAKEYDVQSRMKLSIPTYVQRRDLELECLSEILHQKRFITCHSYVQSEINMLMHVADTFGFKVNTFTHILEGYKVADKMKTHGVTASTFADWWAYKYEVIDAIPYNAYILQKTGVNTCINSDDAEMGRRLNQEAAKSIKYGGMNEEDAWKMVTLNPAKALHLDNKMGSIKIGKDADIVMWTANPLSIYAIVEKTYVDGVCYYDIKTDEAKRAWIQKERARLIQKMLEAKKGGASVQKPAKKVEERNGCMGHESEEE